MSSIKFVVHAAMNTFILLVDIALTLQIREKNIDIVNGDSNNNEGDIHYGNRFQNFR